VTSMSTPHIHVAVKIRETARGVCQTSMSDLVGISLQLDGVGNTAEGSL
jgi:hypothetical protein